VTKRFVVFAVILALIVAISPALGKPNPKKNKLFRNCAPLAEDPAEALKEAGERGCPVALCIAVRASC